jgi:hypothetical protein
MSNTFKNYTSASVGTFPTTVYTVPAVTTAVVIGCNLANVHTSQIVVDVQIAGAYLIKGVPIPANSSLSVLDGKIIMEASHALVVTSSEAASCDVLISCLEQT